MDQIHPNARTILTVRVRPAGRRKRRSPAALRCWRQRCLVGASRRVIRPALEGFHCLEVMRIAATSGTMSRLEYGPDHRPGRSNDRRACHRDQPKC